MRVALKWILSFGLVWGTCMGVLPSEPPNIVFIIADDLGARDLGFMGNREVHTPSLDRLASRSLILERAYVASPSCAPSRGALLSGLMPFRNGAEPNHSYVRDDVKQLPHYMKGLGYDVASIGKITHGTDKRAGFDFDRRDLSFEKIGIVDDYLSGRQSQRPLLLMVGFKDPHVPWPRKPFPRYDFEELSLPARFVDTPETRLEVARYYSDVERMDRQVGETLDSVARHLGSETLIMFTSDHGAQLPYGKWNNYESSLRAPILVSWPGVISGGRRHAALISFVDILPTLIEIAGGTPPPTGYGDGQIDGVSFVDLLMGKTDRHRRYVFSTNSSAAHHTYPLRSVCDDRYRYVRNIYPRLNFTTQTDHNPRAESHRLWQSWVKRAEEDPKVAQKVRRYHRRPAEELFDLKADPDEQHNLVGDPSHRERLATLRGALQGWIDASGDTLQQHGKPMEVLLPVSR